jgi:hypothetical protein
MFGLPMSPVPIMLALCAFAVAIAGSSLLKKRRGR